MEVGSYAMSFEALITIKESINNIAGRKYFLPAIQICEGL